MSSDMDNIINEFLVESYENLDQLDRDLVSLEKEPGDLARLASVFRTIHTIKGACGFLGFSKLEVVAHTGESLLSLLRDGKLQLTPPITTALLSMCDAVRQILKSIEASGTEGERDDSALIAELKALQQAKPAEAAPVAPAAPAPPAPPAPSFAEPEIEPNVAESASAEIPFEPEAVESKPSVKIVAGPITLKPPSHAASEAPAAPMESAAAAPAEPAAQAQGENKSGAVADSSIRVDVVLLDKLMNLVGELVLARNQILQFSSSELDASFLGTSQRLNLITTELQEGVMKTRMQPIGNIWSKFPRVVRDLAVMCGKQIRVEMEGKETELDKTIIEAIKDPLTHIVRNSADHGIEMPGQRELNGKPAEGRLFLRAFHEGGQVNIEISDDGAGIDPDKVRQKALSRGLITAEQAARMTEREAVNLIFLPGLSTAEKITNVSGRGVGMDVVKTNIEKIGGTVDIQSKLGHGTTLKIKIPLTLAIIPALIVTSGNARYAIPQVSLLELVRLEGAQARAGIEKIHGAPVYRLRGNLLPLVYLNRELNGVAPAAEPDAVNIVVLQADDRQFGLVVEGINDTEEIVVKPLGKQMKGISVFAGATIMGDGKVALILDVLGIAQHANVVSEVRDRALTESSHRSQGNNSARESLLLLGTNSGGRLAIPLSKVSRLEEFQRSSLEHAGGQEVVQYRGEIMPLIRLGSMLDGSGEASTVAGSTMQVIVHWTGERSVGLVVDKILDIVEEEIASQRDTKRRGILGSAVIQQKVTDLIDIKAIVEACDPTLLQQPEMMETRV